MVITEKNEKKVKKCQNLLILLILLSLRSKFFHRCIFSFKSAKSLELCRESHTL